MVVCDGPTHGGSTPTKWDRSGSHPSAHTAPRPLVRQIREFVKAVHQASRAGRHARGELGVGMGALHLSFQGCHQPWGQAELAAGCGRYAVLNSAAEYSFFKRNRPVQVLKGSPLLSIIFQTLGTPFERQKKAPPMIRWCPQSSTNFHVPEILGGGGQLNHTL